MSTASSPGASPANTRKYQAGERGSTQPAHPQLTYTGVVIAPNGRHAEMWGFSDLSPLSTASPPVWKPQPCAPLCPPMGC